MPSEEHTARVTRLKFGFEHALLAFAIGATALWWFYRSGIDYFALLSFGFLWGMTGLNWGRKL